MKEIVVKIKPGGEAFMIYSDDSPLRGAGRIDLVRASNVIWMSHTQRWVIQMPDGSHIGNDEGYENRTQAIADEVQLLQKMLLDGEDPYQIGFEQYDVLQMEGATLP